MTFIIVAGYAPGLHGQVGLSGADRRLLLRADAVRDGLRARASGTCARPRRSSTRWPTPSPPRGSPMRRPGASSAANRVRRSRDDAARRHQCRGGGDLRHRPLDHARHHVLGLRAGLERGRLLLRRAPDHGAPERARDLGRLPERRVVPRHRRADLPVRLRRVPVLDRVPRRVPDGDVPAGRADAQRGQVHDRRRALVPPERDAGAGRGRARHVRRRDLLSDRADGRRGRADPGAGRHRLLARGDPHRRVHALLRRLRRHGRHHVGADRQGRAADGRHPRDVDLRARQGGLQPDRAVQPRRGEHDGRVDVLARRPAPICRSRWTPCRSAWRSCSAPPACRTS